VRGGLALGAKVVERGAEPRAEERGPEPVHDGAGREGIVPGDDPVGEVEAGEAALVGAGPESGKEGGGGGEDELAGLVLPVAPGEDADRQGFHGLRDHGPGLAVAGLADRGDGRLGGLRRREERVGEGGPGGVGVGGRGTDAQGLGPRERREPDADGKVGPEPDDEGVGRRQLGALRQEKDRPGAARRHRELPGLGNAELLAAPGVAEHLGVGLGMRDGQPALPAIGRADVEGRLQAEARAGLGGGGRDGEADGPERELPRPQLEPGGGLGRRLGLGVDLGLGIGRRGRRGARRRLDPARGVGGEEGAEAGMPAGEGRLARGILGDRGGEGGGELAAQALGPPGEIGAFDLDLRGEGMVVAEAGQLGLGGVIVTRVHPPLPHVGEEGL